MGIYINVFLLLLACVIVSSNNCVPRDYGFDGSVCVCNDTYCDYVGPIKKVSNPKVLVYTSNRDGLRFQKTIATFKKSVPKDVDVNVTRTRTFQRIEGFGGAFTDAAGINIDSLSDGAKEHLMRSYFCKNGIEYSLCRIPVGATDFSLEAYTYDDGNADPDLKRFALSHYDKEYKIPFINVAQNLTEGKLKFYASCWAAPKWMKTNGKYVGGTIKPGMYQTWANYYVKFMDAYKHYGIKFWGLTTGNEPSLAKFPFIVFAQLPSVGWTPATMATWVAEHLGPTLKKTGYEHVKIMALDDQRMFIPWFIDRVFKNSKAKEYISGTGVHWYFDKVFPPTLLTALHNKYPDKFILSTEASSGSLFWSKGVKLGSWTRAESYANDIIEDLNHWVTGWVDWNMALNLTGGPTYLNNILDAPIIVNQTANEFYKQPLFYALGHFSKFIPPDSLVIDSGKTNKLLKIAVRRPDKGVTVVLLNQNNNPLNFTLYDKCKGAIRLNISAHSITSILYW